MARTVVRVRSWQLLPVSLWGHNNWYICFLFQILQLAVAETRGRSSPDEFRRRRFQNLEPVARRRFRQLRPPETRDGVRREVDDDTPESDPQVPGIEPETEVGRQLRWPPALLHLLDDVCPNFRPIHILDHLRHRTCGDRSLQKGGNGELSP